MAAIAVFVVVFLLLSIRTAFGQSSSTKTLEPAPHPARASTENSNPVDASLAQAKLLADKGTPHDAEPLVRRYLAAHPDSGDAHFLLGYILFREIRDQAAPTGSASDTRYVEKTAEHVGAEFKIKNARASLAEYTEGAKYHVPSAFDLKIVSFDYVLLDDYSDADKWLTKMLEWTPNDPEGWYYLGRTKYNENRFDEALRAFQQSLKLDPHNVKTEDNLGLSYAGLNRTDDAIAAYQTAIAWQNEAAAKNPGPFINMASLLLDQNRTAESLTYLKQAIEISPDDSKPHELLGKAYSRLDQLPQAQSELEKAIEFAPQNPNLPCMLGPLYRKQGLLDKAKLELDRCAALNGTHSSPETPRP